MYLLAALAFACTSSAHFILQWPPTAGFDDDGEPTGPCGGVDVTVDETSPEVQVDRFAVQIQNGHPAGEWLCVSFPSHKCYISRKLTVR